ncbi:MAG: hypothetical protein QM756_45475 [Polyangiaceae bacterium]
MSTENGVGVGVMLRGGPSLAFNARASAPGAASVVGVVALGGGVRSSDLAGLGSALAMVGDLAGLAGALAGVGVTCGAAALGGAAGSSAQSVSTSSVLGGIEVGTDAAATETGASSSPQLESTSQPESSSSPFPEADAWGAEDD